LSLLHEIQESIVQEGVDLGSILLKLRLLASRLGGGTLEEWVKHESEGYPKDVEVPPYRIVHASYHGTWSGPFGSGINNASIPPYLIKEYAGDKWVNIEIRESVAAVDELVKTSAEGNGGLGIDASNLILLLQGKVYKDYSCIDVRASISPTSLAEIRQAVRSRILELTLELEKAIPAAAEVTFGPAGKRETSSEKVQQISQQIIYGNVTTAVAGGHGSNFMLSIGERDTDALIQFLTKSGISKDDATEIAKIMETEEPSSVDEPFGEKAKSWIAANLRKAAQGAWSVGISVATKVLSEAALKYYGLK
jgi:AbiTii